MKEKTIRVFAIAETLVGIACFAYYAVCGAVYAFSLPGLWIFFGAGVIFGGIGIWQIADGAWMEAVKRSTAYRVIAAVVYSVLGIMLAAFFAFECFLVHEWICASADGMCAADGECIAVLGCAVQGGEPGETLRRRINTAREYIGNAENVTVFCCGGRSAEDEIGEGECIAANLALLGVNEECLIVEGNSSSTRENIENIAEMLPPGVGSLTIVSSETHLFRARLIAKRVFAEAGIDVSVKTVGAPSEILKLPCAMVREFAAFVKGELFVR